MVALCLSSYSLLFTQVKSNSSVLKWKNLNTVKKRLIFVLFLDGNSLMIMKFWGDLWWRFHGFFTLCHVIGFCALDADENHLISECCLRWKGKRRGLIWKEEEKKEKDYFCFTRQLIFEKFHHRRQREDCCLFDCLLRTVSVSQHCEGVFWWRDGSL